MRAALPMYDRPELAEAHQAFWALIRTALGQGPEVIGPVDDLWALWRDPDMLFTQTCGYPYRAHLHGTVQLVGTPDYGLPGAPPGYYYSVIVVRADDRRQTPAAFDHAVVAYNEALSQSGWAALVEFAAAQGITLGPHCATGAHRASARAVAKGRADLAAIDAITWRHMTAFDPWTAQLRVLAHTAPTPGLPYITGPNGPVAPLRDAVAAAIAGLPTEVRDLLGLRGLVEIPAADYLAVPNPAPP